MTLALDYAQPEYLTGETGELARPRQMLALPAGNPPTPTLPASSGSRTVPNMIGTTNLYRGVSLSPIALETVAPIWCEDCALEVTPQHHVTSRYVGGSYRYRYGRRYYVPSDDVREVRWNFYPCHLFACQGYRCQSFHETVCDNCTMCENHCECSWCESCETKTSDGTCSNCDSCPNCCECCRCEDCGENHETTTTVNGSYEVCDYCLQQSYGWCDVCEEYYALSDAGEHDHGGCDCLHPDAEFLFPNDPANGSFVRQDERVTVELPSGVISDEGIRAIQWAITDYCVPSEDGLCKLRIDSWDIRYIVEELDPVWSKKDGTFTRRLSKAFYKKGHKIPADLLSTIGNLANEHTSNQNTFRLEVTRDLNGSDSDFGNEGSCWWSSNPQYNISRCAFKNWGGIALRSYASDSAYRNDPSGRVLIQPLDENLAPTADAVRARAYLVYNRYGDMEKFAAARIVAHMTGKTYKKVSLSIDPQYVNGDSGFLIADETTCQKTVSIMITADAHRTFA